MLWVGTSWKMNGSLGFARDYARSLRQADLHNWAGVQPFVIPSFTAIDTVRNELGPDSPVLLGAQNAHWEDEGAWTGEISVLQAMDAGAQLIEIGHSERRANFAETNEVVRRKVEATLLAGARPLLCVGEPAEVFRAGGSVSYITEQADAALCGLDSSSVILAYEPIWAIGENGREPEREDLVTAFAALRERYETRVEAILYGGSVNQKNALDLLNIQGVGGLFVGRSAWSVEGYLDILRIATQKAAG
ncbi:triose-phosphate isomerase [Actinomycetaceae bacterium MB13-C1-2]|nr:triose-phosphate isomerase [Actinomycetaceae bacterium MB13-C1-2]